MSKELDRLIEAARQVPFPAEAREEQRQSFAYGNTRIENERITKETIRRQAQILKSGRDERGD